MGLSYRNNLTNEKNGVNSRGIIQRIEISLGKIKGCDRELLFFFRVSISFLQNIKWHFEV